MWFWGHGSPRVSLREVGLGAQETRTEDGVGRISSDFPNVMLAGADFS
jgi:hypothetical protein